MAKNRTLFDFFKVSPSNKSSPTPSNGESSNSKSPNITTPKSSKTNGSTKKRQASPSNNNTSFSSPSTPYSARKENVDKQNGSVSSKKRRRIVIESDSGSDNDYSPDKEEQVSSEEEEETGDVSTDDSEPEMPKTKKSKVGSTPKSSKKSVAKPKKDNSMINLSLSELTPGDSSNLASDRDSWVHLNLEWLKDDKIRDKNGRPKSHPDYDPKTLFVPESFKKTVTPAHKQWWDMKADHFDTVLFFKVGKFYELFHMDAVIGVKELSLIYMKGDFAHSGFPEISYGRFSDALVQRGYNVARVEQTETPLMMEERCRKLSKPSKFDKVVSREICQITTRGTRVFGCIDGESNDANNHFLLAVTEKVSTDISLGESEYGVCFIDTSVGKFYVGQFADDRHCSRLRTLVAHYPVVELLYEKGAVSKKTLLMFSNTLVNGNKVPIASSAWDPSKILKYFTQQVYKSTENSETDVQLPDVIKQMLDENDVLMEKPKAEFQLAVRAVGACVWHLKECLIDEQLLTMRLFEHYIPLDVENVANTKNVRSFSGQHMVLDGITLRNLEILENNSMEVLDGTLLDTMDYCSTNFGKRLFHQWLCSPLCDPNSINDRLNGVEDLEKIAHIIDEITPLLRKMPDLERLLSKIHSMGLVRSLHHPDSRAIFYEEETYSKRKIMDFLMTLGGFKDSITIMLKLDPFLLEFRSNSLSRSIMATEEGGCFPNMSETLDYFDSAFNHEKAKKDGCIIPNKGVDADYDSSLLEIKQIEAELDEYLESQTKKFQCKVSYFGSAKNRYQLEVPEHAAKHAGSQYEIHSHRKGFKRFYTSETKNLLAQLLVVEDKRDTALFDIMRRIFAKFDQDYDKWKAAVHCLSVLDVFISLMTYKKNCQVTMCRPEIVLPSSNQKPFLKIVEGRHPSLLKCFTGDTYIPNSVYLGPAEEADTGGTNKGGDVILVTGPNMGGKSTLMRQTGLLVIMAQMGSYVPAEVCKLTPVDRVFTRLGASDNLTAGESTFFVEVSETSSILQHATLDSLVLVDELGRGTATYDGTAIACAVVQDLASRIQCRTLFSTHYHSLVDEFASFLNIGLGHMSCMVEDDVEHPALENITFLYKFIDGVCPKSYGFNVAHLAGIDAEIVQKGYKKSKELEKATKYRAMFKSLHSADETNVVEMLQETQELVKVFGNCTIEN